MPRAQTQSFISPRPTAVYSGTVYVADFGGSRIRLATTSGVVTTLAGGARYGSANGVSTAASFYFPRCVAMDASSGVAYVADSENYLIRAITPGGAVSTLAGSGAMGATNGLGTAASFMHPFGVAVDAAGNVIVADGYMIRKMTPSGVIRKMTPSGVVSTVWASAGLSAAKRGCGPTSSLAEAQ